MELNFKIQRNEELQLERLFNKYTRKQNRRHIVADMIEVRKAKKQAVSERMKYYKFQKIPTKRSKLSRWFENSILQKKADKLIHQIKTKIFSYESIYLYVWHIVMDFWDHVKSKKNIYIPLSAVLSLIIVATIGYNLLFGYEITYNGYPIGIVDNLKVFNTAMSNVDANLSKWYSNDNLYYEQSITIRSIFIKDRKSILNVKGCEEAIYACDLPLFINGGVVVIDGIETVRLSSKEEAQQAVDTLIGAYVGKDTDTVQVKDSQIEQNIVVEEKIIAMGTEKTVSEAVSYMQNLASVSLPASGTAANNIDNLINSDRGNNGLITALNFRKSEFSVGDFTTKPALTIKTVKEVTYDQAIPFETTYKDDPNEYMGSSSEISAGVNGSKKVTALISYTNGAESSREILSETMTAEPVSAVMSRGTKPLPPAESTGRFLLPTSGRVSEIFGDSSHAGGCAVDIATRTGTNVYASDSGVVIKASYLGTYGNMIIIDHGNGYTTVYGHLNGYNVTVGQQVNQGQVIGYVGNTGYSTGPHLHFEIRYNDSRQPILSYFSYLAVGVNVNALQ